MAQSTVSNVHYSQLLADLSIGYKPTGMVSEDVFVVVSVVHESDKYAVFNRTDPFTLIDDVRDDGTRAKMVDFGWTYSGYVTSEHALEARLTDRERANADNLLHLEVMKVNGVQGILMLNQENRIATLMSDANQYASTNKVTLSGTGQWNNASFVGSIEQTIDSAKEAIRLQAGGVVANRLVIPKAVALVVKRDAKIRDLVKYTHQDLLVDGDLPPVLWGMKTTIPACVVSRSIEGSATPTLVDLWGKNVFVAYRTEAGSTDTPNFGYIFRVGGTMVQTWHEDNVGATFYRPTMNQAEKVVSAYAGYLITNAIS